ncbi:protein FdrA [Actinomycetospora cinnamomea]|uniref:FdrA protein n=1 Tax=Actinomycetospora cinnamomea TaxID=663609 RepID=A0A2U1F4G3_9PSEU|nr:protein FdrA [Actinomycetospora cinnamomea]PVZ06920.1 FdrA protein [Actinomycetospora cinnamomea]
MTTRVRIVKDTYLDSVVQLSGTRAMRAVEGVDWATAAMATPANVETLAEEGFDRAELADAGPGDLVLAVRAASEGAVDAAEEAGREAMFASRSAEAEPDTGQGPARTQEEALARHPGTNVAVISVPGEHAALETHKALSAGLHVLLFSDNVPVATEVELKTRAEALGLLVMGPGAGTAMLGRTCLGFANVVAPLQERRGAVAVVAAAGTGAQEAAALLDRAGVGVTHVVGLGGRDLGADVGGTMGRAAVRALAADPATEAILLVSKPPDPRVAATVTAEADGTPLVAALVGLEEPGPDTVTTLEAGVLATLDRLGLPRPDVTGGLRPQVEDAIGRLDAERTLVRGLFSGGTLCYESLVVLGRVLGAVYSNTPVDKELGLPAPASAHLCLDLGEEEYTRGRPHPMIDPEARLEHLREQGRDPEVAAIVLDVVLGFGSHPDPASELAPVCAEITADGGPRVVVYVLGTEQDPQGLERQRRAFRDAGCVVTETAARASLAAAAIARREPALAEVAL